MPALYDPNILVFALKGIAPRIGWPELRARQKRLESKLGLPFTRYLSRLRAMNRWNGGGAYNFAMKFWSDSFSDGGAIPAHYAFCAPDPAAHVKLSQNRNPHLAWSDLPKGAQSVVLICHDPDVPSKADDVNQEGRTIPSSLPRVNFVHWVLVDMPASGSPDPRRRVLRRRDPQGQERAARAARHAPGASTITPAGSPTTRT